MQWTAVCSEMGTVYLLAEKTGLVRCTLPAAGPPEDIEPQLRRAECGEDLTSVYANWLRRYFARAFSVPIPPLSPEGSRFARDVYKATAEIAPGSTASYGEIAERAGYPGASRAVGGAMSRTPVPLFVPCHRVIRSDGRLGGFGGGIELKRRLLRHEGLDPPIS